MKRLAVLLIVLVIVLVAVAAELKRNPGGSPEARLAKLTAAEKEELLLAKQQFTREQNRLFDLRDKGASEADLNAQEKRTSDAAERVMALGGAEELKAVGERVRAAHYGGRRGMRGRSGRRAGRSGSAEGGRRPGGLTGEAAPTGSGAGTSHSP